MSFRRALFIRFGGLGDILMATPTLRAVAQAYRGLEIDFVVGGGMEDVLSGNPLVRRVLPFDKRGPDSRLDNFLPFLWRLRRARYDLVINLHPSAKSYLMAAATGAKTRLTFEKNMTPDPLTGHVAHAVDDFGKELRPLGLSLNDRSLDFYVPSEALRRVQRLLADAGVRSTDKVVVINPAASRPLNRWPLERFQEVAAHFAERPGTVVVVTGAPSSFRTVMDGLDEVDLAEKVAAADPRVRSFAGLLSVKEFGALLTRANVLLTCDTGPMHIGSALDTPMVVLSGAADPDRTGPLTQNSVVLIDRALPCVPCRARICARQDVRCMQNLSVGSVTASMEQRLAARREKSGLVLPVLA